MFDLLEKHIRSEIALDPELWKQLQETGVEINIKKNEYLLKQGDVCRYGYFLNKGSLIQLFQHENGKEIVLGFYVSQVYSFLSSPQSYFSGTGSVFEIKALEDCSLLAFRKEDLESMAENFPEFRMFYHKITANALHNTYMFSAMRLSLSAEDFFIYLMKNHPAFLQRIPDKYIARFIGVSDEWLCKVKKRIIKNL
jgi:CRP-like cAMP-binding protein